MGVVTAIRDSLTSLVANLGTSRDKAATASYAEPTLDDDQIQNAYRGSWLARNIVDIPADDTCREWRAWKAEAAQIEFLEAEEKRLDVKGAVRQARKMARLWGGSAIYISIKGQDPSQPLDPATIGKGRIEKLTVMTRHDVVPTEIETDPLSEWYGKPKGYQLANVSPSFASVVIHPSRFVIFYGNAIPHRGGSLTHFWGDSVLLAVIDAVKHAEGTAANIASLIYEAKIDVIRIPDFMSRMNDPHYREQVLTRFGLAATAKGNNGALLLDKDEEYSQKQMSFATLPDVLNAFMQIVSGASRIPATLLIGQAPQGMNATGIGDYRNYLDRIQAEQDLEMSPAMTRLDEALIRSAIGTRPPEVWYDWAPIWTEPPKDRADTFKTMADAARALAGNGQSPSIIPLEALSDATVNALIESGILPGLEGAIEEFGRLAEQRETEEESAAAMVPERNEE